MKIRAVSLALLTLTSGAGCSTIMKNDHENFPVVTEPAGAKVTMGEYTCHTPCDLEVERRKDYTVTIEKPGYKTLTFQVDGDSMDAWLWGNIAFLVGAPVGVAVDFYTGKAYDLSPSELRADLTKETEAAPPAEAATE